mgnify:CR=1 FL=1
MKRQWTPEEAWAWYNDRPWIVGFNYVPACCASIFDMWQEYRHAERMPAITREIERAHEIGYNGIRLFMSFYCWEKEHDGYMQRLEEYLTLFAKNGIRTMIVFGKNGVNQAYTVASNFTDAMLVMDDRQDQLIDVIVGATFDNLQDTKKVPAAGKAITGIQGCVAVDKMTDLPKAPEHDAVNPQS